MNPQVGKDTSEAGSVAVAPKPLGGHVQAA